MPDTTLSPRKKVLIFFNKGDKVRLNVDGAPEMLVKEIVFTKFASFDSDETTRNLEGVACSWFANGIYQERMFNTKDLIHMDPIKAQGRTA